MSTLQTNLVADIVAVDATGRAFAAAVALLTADLQTAITTQERSAALAPSRVLNELAGHLIGQNALPLDGATMRSAMATPDHTGTFVARLTARIQALVP